MEAHLAELVELADAGEPTVQGAAWHPCADCLPIRCLAEAPRWAPATLCRVPSMKLGWCDARRL